MATDGPSPSRIIAAAGSVSAGIGLVALLAGTADSSEVVVHVEPTPVIVAPTPTAPTPTTLAPGAIAQPVAPDPAMATPIQAATPAPTAPPPTTAAPAPVVTTSEGS